MLDRECLGTGLRVVDGIDPGIQHDKIWPGVARYPSALARGGVSRPAGDVHTKGDGQGGAGLEEFAAGVCGRMTVSGASDQEGRCRL